MDGDRAPADCSEGQQTTVKGERFIDAQSDLPAFRYPNNISRPLSLFLYMEMFIFDRYALHIASWKQLKTIDVYDLKTGVRRCVANYGRILSSKKSLLLTSFSSKSTERLSAVLVFLRGHDA